MTDIPVDRFEGCLLGLALGDALGAPHEGGPLERLLWRLIGRTARGEMRWTDDTTMSIDIAESLLACGTLDAADLARRFARSYHWSRGYGPGTAKLLKQVARGQDWQNARQCVYPDGSFGNGGAMRAPVIALFHAQRPAAVADDARRSASITHAHPLGIEGAVLVATATAAALRDASPAGILGDVAASATLEPFRHRIGIASAWIAQEVNPSVREVVRQLGNGISAADSCITAIHAATRFLDRPFADMQAFVAEGGGDVDTIGAMAGAIWGARQGRRALPAALLERLEARDRLAALAASLHALAHHQDGAALP